MLFLEHLIARLQQDGYRFEEVPARREGLPASLPNGVILHGAHEDDPRLAYLRDQGVPFVLVGRATGVRWVAPDDHNGSVWPHDTALIAAGLRRYGFVEQASTLRDALFDLAASQPDLRPPELVAGYERTDSPPVPYPVACRPQAWSSAALAYLSDWARARRRGPRRRAARGLA